VSKKYNFEKPNDRRALDLMNVAATGVMKEMPDVILAYGMSDEYRYAVACLCLGIISFTNMKSIVLCFTKNVHSSSDERGEHT
jgi:tRNA(His) 5'-end guanylyltransferase